MKPVFFRSDHVPEQYKAICSYVGYKVWGSDLGFTDGTAMGVFDENNRLQCGIIFHNYDQRAETLEISGAGETPRWLTRSVLWEMFNYPFNVCQCQAVFMRVDPADMRLRRILTSYGFDYYELPRMRGRNTNEGVYILTDDRWRSNGFHQQKN